MKQISQVERRRQTTRKASKSILQQMSSGEVEPYVGYRQLYRYWCSRNSAVQELRPMFGDPNLSPNGIRSVTDAFNEKITSIAEQILADFRE